ncbi:MAG: hypothetical protein WD470_01600 [Rhodospirillaceae bacterium]
MDFYALARQFVCSIIAASLSLTVAVVEKMLPQRPEWLEKIALLEAQFRAVAARRDGPKASATHAGGPARENQAQEYSGDRSADPAGAMETPHPAGQRSGSGIPADLQGMIDGYSKLLEFVQYVKVRGLMLDPEFCERVEREWTVRTLLSYMLSAEKSLKEQAAEAHETAARYLAPRAGRD